MGSGAFTLKKAIILGSLFEFAGAVIMGRYVTNTIKEKLVSPDLFANEQGKKLYSFVSEGVNWITLQQ